MSNGKLPTKCDACKGPLKRGEFLRLKFDRSYTGVPYSTKWVTDEFKRYYCPECSRKARAWLISFERKVHAEVGR